MELGFLGPHRVHLVACDAVTSEVDRSVYWWAKLCEDLGLSRTSFYIPSRLLK